MIPVGSIWKCTDEDYPAYKKYCSVKSVNDGPGWNGEGTINVLYSDNTIGEMKVRRFCLRHEKVK